MIKNNAGIDYTIANRGYSWGALAVDVAVDYLAGRKPKNHTVENKTLEVTHQNAAKLTPADIQ